VRRNFPPLLTASKEYSRKTCQSLSNLDVMLIFGFHPDNNLLVYAVFLTPSCRQNMACCICSHIPAQIHHCTCDSSHYLPTCQTPVICVTTSTNELISAAVQGSIPPLQQALELHTILSRSDTNLRQPVGLEEQLLMGRMGSDVGQSMLQMLQARPLQPKCFMTVCAASSWELTSALLAFD